MKAKKTNEQSSLRARAGGKESKNEGKTMEYTIEDYSAKTGLTYKQVYDRIRKGVLEAEKRANKIYIKEGAAPLAGVVPEYGDERMTKGARLKEALTAMQIKKIQQQLREGQEEIRRLYKGEVVHCLTECLSAMRDYLLKLNLNETQTAELNECISTTLKRLELSLN